jgi:hypothetical protein
VRRVATTLREIRLQHMEVALDDAAQIADIGAWVSIARSSLRKSSGASGSPPISYVSRSHGHMQLGRSSCSPVCQGCGRRATV